jgi:SnoaL-like domain
MEDIVARYLDTWNVTDANARRRKVDAIFTEACSYTDPMAAVSGTAGIDGFIGAVQKQFAGVSFVLAGRVDAHHDVARFTWHAVAPGSKEPLAIGFDVLVLEGGRIKQVVGFLDKAPG